MTDQEPATPATASGVPGLPPTPPLQPEIPAAPAVPAVASEAFVPPSTGYRAPGTSTTGRAYEVPSIPLPDPVDPTRARRAALAAVPLGVLLVLAPFLAWFRVDVIGIDTTVSGYGAVRITIPDVGYTAEDRAALRRDADLRDDFPGVFGSIDDGFLVGVLGLVVIALGIAGAVGLRREPATRFARRRGPYAMVGIGLLGLCWLAGSVRHTAAAYTRFIDYDSTNVSHAALSDAHFHLGVALLVSAVLFVGVATCGVTAARNG